MYFLKENFTVFAAALRAMNRHGAWRAGKPAVISNFTTRADLHLLYYAPQSLSGQCCVSGRVC
jgi:hypothetical protein